MVEECKVRFSSDDTHIFQMWVVHSDSVCEDFIYYDISETIKYDEVDSQIVGGNSKLNSL